jgi:hypothetical protein
MHRDAVETVNDLNAKCHHENTICMPIAKEKRKRWPVLWSDIRKPRTLAASKQMDSVICVYALCVLHAMSYQTYCYLLIHCVNAGTVYVRRCKQRVNYLEHYLISNKISSIICVTAVGITFTGQI